jgi:prepilin-type N-terminal cleavage/methylation domain-containing protein
MQSYFYKLQRGVTLIEVVIAIAIISIMIVVVGYSVMTYVDARAQLLDNTKKLYLAEEGIELLRVLRDEDWTAIESLTVDDTYGFSVSTTTIATAGTVEEIDGTFYRSFVVSAVRRDANDDIDFLGGGTIDPDTRLVTVSVFGPTSTTSLSAILTNINAI